MVDETPRIKLRYLDGQGRKHECVLQVDHVDVQKKVITGHGELPGDVRRLPQVTAGTYPGRLFAFTSNLCVVVVTDLTTFRVTNPAEIRSLLKSLMDQVVPMNLSASDGSAVFKTCCPRASHSLILEAGNCTAIIC